jgi:hypothetical protein
MTAHDFPELNGMPPEEAVHTPWTTSPLMHILIGMSMFGTSIDQRTQQNPQESLDVGSALQRIKALQ